MIKEILRLINKSGVVNECEIAEATHTSTAMVQQAIDTLQSKGYLKLVNLTQNCQTAKCTSCGHCNPSAPTSKYAYVVTEKGKKYLQYP
jgi:predicted transcriptional regulator